MQPDAKEICSFSEMIPLIISHWPSKLFFAVDVVPVSPDGEVMIVPRLDATRFEVPEFLFAPEA